MTRQHEESYKPFSSARIMRSGRIKGLRNEAHFLWLFLQFDICMFCLFTSAPKDNEVMKLFFIVSWVVCFDNIWFINFVVAFFIQFDDDGGFYSTKVVIYHLWIMTRAISLSWYEGDLKFLKGNAMKTKEASKS
jgi:hypothetical protein